MTRDIKDTIASRPVLAGMVAGLLVALLSLSVFTLVMGWRQLQRMHEAQVEAMSYSKEVARESRAFLMDLNRDFQPDCSERNLQSLREFVFSSAFTGEAGVLDEAGRLICTTLAGRLEKPVELPVPDITGVNAVGVPVKINVDLSLSLSGRSIRVFIVRSGRFTAVLNPNVQEKLRAGQDVLRFRLGEGKSSVFMTSPALSEHWKQRLGQPDLFPGPVHRFSWRDGAFISSLPVESSLIVSQRVMPVAVFIEEFKVEFSFAVLAALLTGLLAYAATVQVFLRWSQLGHRLKRLLVDDNIVCVYQPIIELKSGATVGCEVLMRLRDGAELIYPDQLLRQVLAQKLEWKLDQAVVRKAIRELSDSLPMLPGFKVAFNFFPDNIRHEQLSDLFDGALKKAQPRGFKFELEVLEHHYEREMLQEIAQLKQAGFQISVDDFGTGYSNLGSVKALAPDLLKIDKSFVFEMQDASVRSSLIPEIVGIARAVGALVIAEGVEYEEQRRMLLEVGVDFGQGYWFARPMGIDSFARFLQDAVAAGKGTG